LRTLKEAKKYAKTLLDRVGIEKAPQALSELNAINDLMVKSKEFKSLLVNPQFTIQEREEFVKQIAGKLKISDAIIKYVLNLTERMLIIHLSEIIRIATSLYLEKKKRTKAVITTPVQISKSHEEKLLTSLKKLTERDVDIEYVIDPSLIGGILIKVGSNMYDTSIKGQLGLLKNELIKG
jgi:F-type H+-transporting ATPase subunit delta